MSRRTTFLALLGALVLALLVAPAGAQQAPPPPPGPPPPPTPTTVVERASAYLRSTQQPDGGFDVLGAYFEHPDVVLALAEAAQDEEPGWGAGQALGAIEALETDSGETPLTYLDDLVDENPDDVPDDADVSAGQAARLIVQVVAPLGLDPADFDPDEDAGTTDLVSVLDAGAQPDGSYGFFNATLYAALAHPLLGRPVPQVTEDLVRGAQRFDGSWNYLGDGDPEVNGDADTTALAVQALVAAGAEADDPAVLRGLRFLARQVDTDGSVDGFSEVNSTAVTALAVTAGGWDPDEPCWRQRLRPRSVGRRFTGATDYFASQQRSDGGIADDPDGSVAFASAQAVQALSAKWLPVGRLGQQCATSGQFVEQLWQDLVRPVPTQAGASAPAVALRAGAGRAAVARGILDGGDYRRSFVRRLFREYLGDEVPAQVRRYRRLLARGVPSLEVTARVIGSVQIADSDGREDTRRLYRDLLGRRPTEPELADGAAMVRRTSVTDLARVLLDTGDGRRHLVRALYGEVRADPYPGLLDRRPTRDERRDAAEVLAGGGSPEFVVAGLSATVEYDLRARS